VHEQNVGDFAVGEAVTELAGDLPLARRSMRATPSCFDKLSMRAAEASTGSA